MEQQKQQNQHSSLVARLNARLLVRLAGIYFCMDLLLTVLCLGGVVVWAEGRCADVAALVDPVSYTHLDVYKRQVSSMVRLLIFSLISCPPAWRPS